MKKIYLILFVCIAFLGTKATTYTVAVSGFAFSPATLNINIGDMVVFTGLNGGGHPTAQVSSATWVADGTTTLTAGWGVKTADFTYTATTVGTVYYVCQFHVGTFSMKGTINVGAVGINETSNLLQNTISLFPNPAQNNINVSFALSNASNVSIKLFNAIGQEVKVLTPNTNLPEGNYNYNYDLPATLATGNYFLEVSSNNKLVTKKLIINK